MSGTYINTAPLIILGHQKTGNSAIAALLGKAIGKSVIIDMFHRNNKIKIKPSFRKDLFEGTLLLEDFIRDNALYFSTDIVKEPDLTFRYEDLLRYFPQLSFIFVIRDPRDTIRSIFNRLDFPGNEKALGILHKKKLNQLIGWKFIFEGRYPHVAGQNYIEKLAHRWNLAADIYTEHKSNITIVRYEDFVKNKIEVIYQTAIIVGMEPIYDIADKIDTQYQPRGHREVKWIDFFGSDNLNRIETICTERMHQLRYYSST